MLLGSLFVRRFSFPILYWMSLSVGRFISLSMGSIFFLHGAYIGASLYRVFFSGSYLLGVFLYVTCLQRAFDHVASLYVSNG